MSRAETSTKGRLLLADMLVPERNCFGVIRLAMALAVLVSHCFYLGTGTSKSEPFHAATGYSLGEYGVQVFFVISGLLVAQSFDRSRSIVDFAVARTLRIFPALLVCVLMTVLVLGPLLSKCPPLDYLQDTGDARYAIRTLLLTTGSAPLPGLFESNPVPNLVNLSLWTLKYEVICYAVLAMMGALLWTQRVCKYSLTAAAAVLVAFVFYRRPELADNNGLVANIRYFAVFFGVGVLAYVARSRLIVSWHALPILAAAFALSIGTYVFELVSAISLGYAAIWIASWRLELLRPLTADRDMSFGVYIYSVPITQALLSLMPDLGIPALIAYTATATLPLAFVSWHLIERPALQRRTAVLQDLRSRSTLLPI